MNRKKLLIGFCVMILTLIASQSALSQTPFLRKVIWSSSGDLLLVANEDMVCIHETEEFKSVLVIDNLDIQISAMALDNERGQLITGHLDGTINFWNLDDGTIVETANFYDLSIEDIEISDDGALLAITTRNERRTELWERDTLTVRTRLLEEMSCRFCANPVFDVEFSPDNQFLALRSLDAFQTDLDQQSVIWIWDLASDKELVILDYIIQDLQMPYYLISIKFSADGRFILGSDILGSLLLWNVETSEFLGITAVHSQVGAVRGIFNPTDQILAVGGRELYVAEFSISDSGLHLAKPIILKRDPIASLAFNAPGERLATIDTNEHVVIWDIETGSQIADFQMCGD